MSHNIPDIGVPFPEEGNPRDRFIALPLALQKNVIDVTQKTPMRIGDAMSLVANGMVPPQTGMVDVGSDMPHALNLMAFRNKGRNTGVIAPMPKDALERNRIVDQGAIFLTNSEGLFIPVALVHELGRTVSSIEVDFNGFRRVGGFVVELLNRWDVGVFEATNADDKSGTVELKRPNRYF